MSVAAGALSEVWRQSQITHRQYYHLSPTAESHHGISSVHYGGRTDRLVAQGVAHHCVDPFETASITPLDNIPLLVTKSVP